MAHRPREAAIDILITGARVYTADPAAPWAEALLVRDNHIAVAGTEEEARDAARQAEEIRCDGGLAVPGLNDSHIHMTYGARALTILNLEGVTTRPELQARLREYAAANPALPWIEAYGMPHEPLLALDRPEREALDEAVADRPVFVRAFDYHSAWCNTEALRRAGIERGARVPPPNEVVVDANTGLATGWLKEREAYDIVSALLPEPDEAERDHSLVEAMRYVNRFGIVSVQNMDADPDRLEQYGRLQARGHLTVRASHYLSVRPNTPLDRLDELAEYTRRYTDPFNRAAGIKLFIDGVVESKTALLLEPYADGSGDRGAPDMDLDRYDRFVSAAHDLSMSVATHAIGDLGVRTALDAYERAQRRKGTGARHRIEHIEVIDPADLHRFRRLDVTASMQPFHAAPTTDPTANLWTRLVGPAREPYAFAWRSLLEAGAALAFGSDWSIVTPDVRVGLRTAVERVTVGSLPLGGWQPQQAITLAQALDAYTRGAARAERMETFKGTLRPGMAADVTIFAHDLFRLRPREFPGVPIALTMLAGRIVHRST